MTYHKACVSALLSLLIILGIGFGLWWPLPTSRLPAEVALRAYVPTAYTNGYAPAPAHYTVIFQADNARYKVSGYEGELACGLYRRLEDGQRVTLVVDPRSDDVVGAY